MLTEKQVQKILDEAGEQIKENLKLDFAKAMSDSIRWKLEEETSKVVNEFVVTEIVPEIKKFMVENKEGIIKSATTAALTVGDKLAAAMIERAIKNLSQSWNVDKLSKEIFG